MNIQEGDILLSHTNRLKGESFIGQSLIPKAIRFVTGSYWNHAAIVLKIHGVLYILEADIHGVRITKTLKQYITECKIGKRDCGIVRPNIFMPSRLVDVLGVKYDAKALLIDQTFYQVGKKFNKDWYWGHSKNHALKSLYCSEVVLYLCGDDNYYKKTPADIAKEFNVRKLNIN